MQTLLRKVSRAIKTRCLSPRDTSAWREILYCAFYTYGVGVATKPASNFIYPLSPNARITLVQVGTRSPCVWLFFNNNTKRCINNTDLNYLLIRLNSYTHFILHNIHRRQEATLIFFFQHETHSMKKKSYIVTVCIYIYSRRRRWKLNKCVTTKFPRS